jgi:hypothetical protein
MGSGFYAGAGVVREPEPRGPRAEGRRGGAGRHLAADPAPPPPLALAADTATDRWGLTGGRQRRSAAAGGVVQGRRRALLLASHWPIGATPALSH